MARVRVHTPSVVRQYLNAGLIDEMHLAIVPILLGNGERLFEHAAGNLPDQYECAEFRSSDAVTHARIARR